MIEFILGLMSGLIVFGVVTLWFLKSMLKDSIESLNRSSDAYRDVANLIFTVDEADKSE